MLLEELSRPQSNEFLDKGLIPLGMNSYKGNSPYKKNKIICMPYQKSEGAWGVIAKSGTGKTVLIKRIYSYILGYYAKKRPRPSIIFDMQSEDHHLSKFPNSRPFNLLHRQGEKAFGFDEVRCYAPVFILEEAHKFDRPFGFTPKNYDTRDFATLGMGWGAAKFLQFLIKKHQQACDDMEKLFNALNDLPTNTTEYKRLPAEYMFALDSFVNYSSKMSLMNNFTIAYEDNVFVDTKNPHYKEDFTKEMEPGKVIVINLHQEGRYYPLYAGKILRDIYYRRRAAARKEIKESFRPPVIIIEEADLLAPKDSDDRYSSIHWLEQILKRGRKYGFFTIIATQEASAMHDVVRNHTREWILGQLSDPDIPYFSRLFSDELMSAVMRLDKSKHEFLIRYEDGTFDTFYAWNSPVEINRGGVLA